MICVDTTFLVDLWRNAGQPDAGCCRLLRRASGEVFVAPAHAAGEFLEGGAAISPGRFDESLLFLRLFSVGDVGLETAEQYARIAADLRARNALSGLSKPDLWIAAWALEHGCPLATRNTRHFKPVRRLVLMEYGL